MKTIGIKATRSDGLTFNYESADWGVTTLTGNEFPEVEVFTESQGFGNGEIVTGKRKKGRTIEIAAKLQNFTNLTNFANLRKMMMVFHNASYTFDLEITVLGTTRIVKDCNITASNYPTVAVNDIDPTLTVAFQSPYAVLFADFTDNEQMFSITGKWHCDRYYVDETYITGGGVIFDGVDDVCAISDNSSLALKDEDFTIEFNINISEFTTSFFSPFCKRTASGVSVESYSRIYPAYLSFYYSVDGITEKVLVFTYAFSVDASYYIQLIRDGSDVNVYVNNVFIGTKSIGTDSIYDSNADLVIGALMGYGNKAYLFNGTLNIFRVYNKALTQAEITQNYNGDIVTDGLQMYLDGADFTNDPETTSWIDRSGNGNNATPSGFDYTTSSGSDETGKTVKATQNIYGVETRIESKNIYYSGSEDAPIIATLTATGVITEDITLTVNDNSLVIDCDLTTGDVLEINAETYDVIKNGSAISPSLYNSEVFLDMNMEYGDNTVSITAEDNLAFSSVINYTGRYDGV